MGLILRLETDGIVDAVMCEMMRILSDESGGVSENAFIAWTIVSVCIYLAEQRAGTLLSPRLSSTRELRY